MNETRLRTIEQMKEFLNACGPVAFTAAGEDGERYGHIRRVQLRFDYPERNKRERGVVLRYLQHTRGYRRAQVTRRVARWQGNRRALVPPAKRYGAPNLPFARKYTPADVALRVEMDKAHEGVCGPAIACLLQRAYRDYDDTRYERLAQLSVSPLYSLRKSRSDQAPRTVFAKTHPACNAIGVRKAPAPEGRAGFVRIDSVHRGDQDGIKGWHIPCVDAVSQGQVEACVERIREAHLLPVLAQIIAQFPFGVAGFHSDNGSEYVNSKVAKLLEKLRIEQTKSRSRQSNDNALAKSKNASVVRKHMYYDHIPQKYARPINAFYRETFNPWLNLHRPCLFATPIEKAKGKIVKRYKHEDVKTPLDCLALLNAQGLVTFRDSRTLAALQAQASAQTDLAAAQAMQHAKHNLFATFVKPQRRA